MQAILFSQNRALGFFFQQAFKAENLSTESIVGPFSFMEYRNFPTNIMIFCLPVTKELTDFIDVLRMYRPYMVTVFLDDMGGHEKQSALFDLYFQKPFSYKDIVFELQQTFFYKQRAQEKGMIAIGKTELDLFTREVSRNPYKFTLCNKEFSLLQLFMMNPGKVFTRTQLLELIWDQYSTVATNTVDVHICRLRRRLHQCRSKLDIKSIPCVGYIFLPAGEKLENL